MSSAETEKKEETFGYLCLDIECTGALHGKDLCFAFGYAHGDKSAMCASGKFITSLGKKDEQTWEDVWKENNFEMRCYNDFWSNNTDILVSLNEKKTTQNSGIEGQQDLAAALNKILSEVEVKYDRYTIVFDTVAFDSVWLDVLLSSYGYPGLLYNRNGKYHKGSTYDLDSYAKGAVRCMPHEERKKRRRLTAQVEDMYTDLLEDGVHDPEVDAINIYKKLLHLIEFCDEQLDLEETEQIPCSEEQGIIG